MRTLLRLFLVVVVVTGALFSLGCNRDKSDADNGTMQLTMAELRAKLESGASVSREEPFEIRPFDPYVGEDWIGNAVAYGMYRAGQAPGQKGPTDAELLEDLTIIAEHWQMIRVYGSDDDTKRMLQLIDKHKLPIKVIQGIWLSPEKDNPQEREANINSVLLGIELANRYPDIVNAVSVGNETRVFWSGHQMEPDNLIRYIRTVRDNVRVPVTTADDYLYWNKPESREVAAETDFVFTHIHPLWNGKTLERAVEWMDSVYQDLQDVHPDRVIVVGETGWATDYDSTLTGPGEQGALIKGEVSVDAQGAFLIEMEQWVESNKITTFLFEAFDEPWKGGGENSSPDHIEKHWGVYYEDRTPKESFLQYMAHRRETAE